MDEILYLEADEEITSVVDKIKGLDAKSIGLVAPKGSTIVQSVVSLKLLKKQAEDLKKNIAIVTTDEVGRNLASRVGLPVFADTKSAEPLNILQEDVPDVGEVVEIDMSEKATKLPKDFEVHRYDQNKEKQDEKVSEAPARPTRAPQAPPPSTKRREFVQRPVSSAPAQSRAEIEAARPIKAEAKAPQIKPPRKKTPWIIAGVGVIILIVLVGADLLLARLTVTIAIPADPLLDTAKVEVERDRAKTDLEKGIIPGTQVQKEQEFSEIFKSTGEKDAGEKASGTLTFKNESGVNENVDAGATVVASSGHEFTLLTSITVPKASLNPAGDKVLGQAEGQVEAKEAGDGYNLSSSTSYTVMGKSKIAVSGGTSGGVTKVIKVVATADLSEAENSLQEKGKVELLKSVAQNSGEKTIEGAEKIEVVSFASTKNANDEADEFKATAKVRLTTLTYKQENLEKVSLEQLRKKLKEGEGILATAEDVYETTVASSDINVGKVTLDVKVTTHTGPAIDLTEMAKKWRFQTITKIKQQASEIPAAQIRSIELWPQYALPIAPVRQDGIVINLEYLKK